MLSFLHPPLKLKAHLDGTAMENRDNQDASSASSSRDSAGIPGNIPKRKKQLLKRGSKANATQPGSPRRLGLTTHDLSSTDSRSQLDPASQPSLASYPSYEAEEDEEERAQQCSRESLIELYSHLSQPRFALRCGEPPRDILLSSYVSPLVAWISLPMCLTLPLKLI